jgi:hypothetical protein
VFPPSSTTSLLHIEAMELANPPGIHRLDPFGMVLSDRCVDRMDLEDGPIESRMDAICRTLENVLRNHRVATLYRQESHITLLPIGAGFPISLSLYSFQSPILVLGGWHDDDYIATTALKLIELALRGDIRLNDTSMNGKPWKHEVEIVDAAGCWRKIGEIGYLRFCLLRRDITTRTRQYPAHPLSD